MDIVRVVLDAFIYLTKQTMRVMHSASGDPVFLYEVLSWAWAGQEADTQL